MAVRWFDARESIIATAGANWQWLGVSSFTPLDEGLQTEFPGEPLTTTQDFKLYALDAVRFRQTIGAWTCVACPVTFDQTVTLLGLQTNIVDGTLIVQSAWRVARAGQPVSTAVFMHLMGRMGKSPRRMIGWACRRTRGRRAMNLCKYIALLWGKPCLETTR